jgi:hypothetical protein
MINKHVGPGRRMDTKRRPFNMAVKTAVRIAAAGKVDSVANLTALEIRVCLCGMHGEKISRVRFSGIGTLV